MACRMLLDGLRISMRLNDHLIPVSLTYSLVQVMLSSGDQRDLCGTLNSLAHSSGASVVADASRCSRNQTSTDLAYRTVYRFRAMGSRSSLAAR